jgi:hypothetical protein
VADATNARVYKINPDPPYNWILWPITVSGNTITITMESGDPVMVFGAASTTAPTIPTAPQIWSLDSESIDTDINQMEKNYGAGDDGQSGNVPIPAGTSRVFIADEMAGADVTYPEGVWVLFLSTDQDWGTGGDACDIEIGYYTPGAGFISLTPAPTLKSSGQSFGAIPDAWAVLGERLVQADSITIPDDTYLALQVTNNSAETRVINTGEGKFNSYLRSPETDPGYPLPETAAAVLMFAGLLGLGGYILIKRRKASAQIARTQITV